MKEKAIAHLNIIGFKAVVAGVKDKSLQGRPYVIAGAAGGRSLALDCSPEALRQGAEPGITLAAAQRRIKDLIVLPLDIPAYEMMNSELEKAAARYAPSWENDRAGNLYLDITGVANIFGRPVDCSSRILRDILEQVDIRPAAAVASSKLVSKVATRTIRPTGLIQVQPGTEAEFMSHQDIKILPGMGPVLLRTAAAAGLMEIGDVAALSISQSAAIFGKKGPLLRNMAQGIDENLVEGQGGKHRITGQADFNEDVIDETAILGAVESLIEHGGLKMRNEKLGAGALRLSLLYSDGVKIQGAEKTKRLLAMDGEIMAAASSLYKKTALRRIRLRSIALCLEDLSPLGYQPDLFEPETQIKNRRLQEAVDKIQNRYGTGKISKGLVLAASAAYGSFAAVSGGAAMQPFEKREGRY